MKKILLLIGCLVCFQANGCDENGFEISNNLSQLEVVKEALTLDVSKLDDSLYEYIDLPCGEETVEILMGFDNYVDITTKEFQLSYNEGKYQLNNHPINDSELNLLYKQLDNERDDYLRALHNKRLEIVNQIKKLDLIKDDKAFEDFVNGFDALHVTIDGCQLAKLTNIEHLIKIEKNVQVEPGTIESAMQSTYVAQSSNYQNNHNGSNIGIYLSEPVCPPVNYLGTNYTILSGTNSSGYTDEHARKTTRVLRDVSPNAHIYCRPGMVLPTESDLGTAHSPRISIISLSYGSNTSYYQVRDQAADDLVYNNAATVVAMAGNFNNCTGTRYITSPGKGLNVITVGNYNDYNYTPSSFEISGTSCYINSPDTKSTKPELSAPGTNITGATNANGVAYTSYSGTSFSTPHVAGMLANFASMWSDPINAYTSFKGNLFKLATLMAAQDSVKGGFNKVGVGGADFYRMYYYGAYTLFYANSFDSIANASYQNPKGTINWTNNYQASTTTKGKVGITWLVRGSYTLGHLNDPYPIGSSYALSVYDPNGDLIASGWNPHDNYVIVEFDRLISGDYRFAVHKIAERDPNATLRMFIMAW